MFEKQVIHDPKQHRAINTGQFPGQYVKGKQYCKQKCLSPSREKSIVLAFVSYNGAVLMQAQIIVSLKTDKSGLCIFSFPCSRTV